MPVLVVGADTPTGSAIIAALAGRDGELRCFVSDSTVAIELKSRSTKVALGDVSDGSHVGAAGINCFSMVFVTEAARDERVRSFASSPEEVFEQWQEAIEMAGVQRVIWVEDEPSEGSGTKIVATELAVVVGRTKDTSEIAARVVELDEVADLSSIV
ncbi:MAG: hypothetical protein JJE47_13065 [Acidimicrobiia bacterium]|nr:hypothetical protein [Acidimicrobiia bacterium]